MVTALYHYRDEENGGGHVLNLPYGVPDCDNTRDGDVTGTSEVGGNEVECRN